MFSCIEAIMEISKQSKANNNQEPIKYREILNRLLLGEKMCSVCFESDDLTHWNDIYLFKNEIQETEFSLKAIIETSFGHQVTKLLCSEYFCETCITTILKAYTMISKIKNSSNRLQKDFINISMQLNRYSTTAKRPELMLTIDNVVSLQVPTMVTVVKQKAKTKAPIVVLEAINFKPHKVTDEPSTVSQSDAKYECPFCNKKSNDFNSLQHHYITHVKETQFACNRCPKRFHTLNRLIEHRNIMHCEKLSTCHKCQLILHNVDIGEHEKEHQNDVFICDTCQSTFPMKSQLIEHIGEKHSDFSVTCPHCLNNFKSEFKLTHHRCLFKCRECEEECIHRRFLLSYREQYMANHRIFQCIDCDFTYTSRSKLICHANEHLHHFPYLCDQCGDSFAGRPLLTNHMYKIHANLSQSFGTKPIGSPGNPSLNNEAYQCDFCGYCLNTEEAYLLHRKKHLYEETQCQYCSKSFGNIGKLNIHIKNRHPDEMNSKITIYQCTMCSGDFEFRTEYLRHVATHPRGSQHICRQCNESFHTKKTYFSHVKKHSIKFNKECPICFKKYTKYTISRHMRNHLKEHHNQTTSAVKSITCVVCRKKIPNEVDLLSHSKKHSEVQKCPICNRQVNRVLYEHHTKIHEIRANKMLEPVKKSCPHCDYATKFAICFEAHINRFHLKTRPYQCDVCNKRFYSDYTLQGHKSIHKARRPELYCKMCSKKFISKKSLTLHTRIHTGEQPYPCDLCNLSFLSASRRNEHRIRKHFEPTVECGMCHKKLYTNSDLRRHQAYVHGGAPKEKGSNKKVELLETEIVSASEMIDESN